jgi:starvation-inducible DNA-binding protein
MSTQQITSELNGLLADYMVYYQKLRNYHWNVKGHEFFKLHEEFEMGYVAAAEWADSIAERILALGERPYSTMKSFLDNAHLDEDAESPHWRTMVQNLVGDIESLNKRSINIIETAENAHDRTTANLLDGIVDAQEERLWMFRTFLKE